MSKRYDLIGYCSYRDNETGRVSDNFVGVLNEQDQKIKELEHRLSNCIEPKFKQGDKCYVIETRYVNVVEYFVVNEVEYFGENIDGIITFEEGCRCGCTPDRYSVEKRENVFATEEEAKAKLEELKNG